jgi:effector-binding domain-containing protein
MQVIVFVERGMKPITIEARQDLHFENLLCSRKNIPQEQIQKRIEDIESFMEKKSIKKIGPVITAVYTLDFEEGKQMIDLEILVPVNKEFSSEKEYVFRNEFSITRALRLQYRDKPALLQEAYVALNAYMAGHGLAPVTPMYNVYINNNVSGYIPRNTEIDIYVGVTQV